MKKIFQPRNPQYPQLLILVTVSLILLKVLVIDTIFKIKDLPFLSDLSNKSENQLVQKNYSKTNKNTSYKESVDAITQLSVQNVKNGQDLDSLAKDLDSTDFSTLDNELNCKK